LQRIRYGTRKRSSFGLGHGFPFVENPSAAGAGNAELSDGKSGGGRDSPLRSKMDSIGSNSDNTSAQRFGGAPWKPVVDEKKLRDGSSMDEGSPYRRTQKAAASQYAPGRRGGEAPGSRLSGGS